MAKTAEKSVAEVAETIAFARDHHRGTTLLIGAGCSSTAGIPLANEFVQLIRKRFPKRCENLRSSGYAAHMGVLGDGERHDIIAPYIDQARINWAHMAIAQLMKHGYVTRILTTNFDPLIVQACAIAGVFPAVYDLASSSIFKPAQVRDPSVFYLHGQRLGFVMLNTQAQVDSHFETLGPVFDRAGEGRVWIVAGYSGANDPVFSHIAGIESFGHNLYWVGYGDNDPSPHVSELVSRERCCAYYVRGYDADRFFVDLARALECFPPEIVSKPFSHLSGFLELLMPFPPMPGSDEDLKEAARTRIQRAIDTFETGEAAKDEQELRPEALDLSSMVLAGKYDAVLEAYEREKEPSSEARNAAYWARIERGNDLLKQGRAAVDGASLFDRACSEYSAAVQIKRDEVALNNWGNALTARAQCSSGNESERLWNEAYERYAEAIQLNLSSWRVLDNWAISLVMRARRATADDEKERWLLEGEEKCEQVEDIRPGYASYNRACVYGIRGDSENCRKWLERSKKFGFLPSREHILADHDLAAFHSEPWLQELLSAEEAS